MVRYRLADEISVRRAKGVFWTLTFVPIGWSPREIGSPRLVVVTVSDAAHAGLVDHAPVFVLEEIQAMAAPKVPNRPRRHRTVERPGRPG